MTLLTRATAYARRPGAGLVHHGGETGAAPLGYHHAVDRRTPPCGDGPRVVGSDISSQHHEGDLPRSAARARMSQAAVLRTAAWAITP